MFAYIIYIGLNYYLEIPNSNFIFIFLGFVYGYTVVCICLRPYKNLNKSDICIFIVIGAIALGYYFSFKKPAELIFVLLLLINYLAGRKITHAELPKFFKAIFCVGTLAFVLTTPQLPGYLSNWYINLSRPELYGSAAYSSAYANNIAILLLTVLGFIYLKKTFRLLKWGFALVLIAVIILSSARIVMLGLIITLFLLVLIQKKFALLKLVVAGFVFFVMTRGVLNNMPENYKRFNTMEIAQIFSILTEPAYDSEDLFFTRSLSDLDVNNTVEVRIRSIKSCYLKFLKTPVFGYGPNKMPIPHNSLLQILFEHGLIVALSFLVIIFRNASKLFKIIQKTSKNIIYLVLAFAIFIYVIIYNCVMGTTLNSGNLFMFTGIIVSLVHSHSKVNSITW